MNRDQKAVAIADIATKIDESEAILAVDYRGITVEQVAELRAKLREADASFKVVKNSLTERAADQVGAEQLKGYLTGPTALTFVRGDVALAAKAVADYAKATQLLPFKGGTMGGEELAVDQIRELSRLPSREVLYGQLVGIVASPIGGLVRSLNALIGGLAIALGEVNQKKQSGEIPAGEAPAAPAQAEAEAPAAEEAPAAAEEAPDAEAPGESEEAPDEAEETPAAEAEETPAEAASEETPAEAPAEAEAQEEQQETEPEAEPTAQADDNEADVSAQTESDDAETTKED